MKKLSDKGRRILRMIYQGFGATAVSLLFQACYGTPMDMEITIKGVVRSPEDEPIPGIQVSVKDLSSQYLTNSDGSFYIGVPEQNLYELTFEDVDGPANGFYKTLEKTITMNEAGSSLTVQLEAN